MPKLFSCLDLLWMVKNRADCKWFGFQMGSEIQTKMSRFIMLKNKMASELQQPRLSYIGTLTSYHVYFTCKIKSYKRVFCNNTKSLALIVSTILGILYFM